MKHKVMNVQYSGFLPVNHVLPQFYNVLFLLCVISTFRVCSVGFRGAPPKAQIVLVMSDISPRPRRNAADNTAVLICGY